MTNDWLHEWQWSDDLSPQRWLILSHDEAQLGAAAARRGATVTFAPLNDEQALPPAEIVVAQQFFTGIRHPLWWLEKLCASTLSAALFHCRLTPLPADRARMSFDDLQGWQVNRTALPRLIRAAGFAHVTVLSESAEQIWLKAARQWPDFPAVCTPSLTIERAVNPVNGQSVFPRSGRAAFATFFVAGLPADARRWEVRISVGPFGAQPLRVAAAPDGRLTQVNIALPPGLPLGRAAVQLWHRERCAKPCEIEVVEGTQW